MTNCKRKGKFNETESHECFKKGCMAKCYPALSETCPICNWKRCTNNHCGCDLTPEARFAVDILYRTFCTYCEKETEEEC